MYVFTETLEELNIPSLDEKYEEKESVPISNGSPKLGINESHLDVDNAYLKFNEALKALTRNNDEIHTVRNISPQLGEAEEWTPEQSNSEDSSLSDSDKTLVGDAPDCYVGYYSETLTTSNRKCRMTDHFEIENWDIDDDSDYYFRATPCIDSTQQKRMLLMLRMLGSISS